MSLASITYEVLYLKYTWRQFYPPTQDDILYIAGIGTCLMRVRGRVEENGGWGGGESSDIYVAAVSIHPHKMTHILQEWWYMSHEVTFSNSLKSTSPSPLRSNILKAISK